MALIDRISDKVVDILARRASPRVQVESAFLRRYFARRFGIRVGAYSYGAFNRWRIPRGTEIGRYCSIAATARIINANHPTATLSTHPYFYELGWGVTEVARVVSETIVIEDDVWIGHNAVVLPTARRIGRGSIIGAGTVVTKDVPPYAIVVGVPGRIARMRFSPEVIALIEASRWWERDKAGLVALMCDNPEFFANPAATFATAPGVA